MNKKDNGADRNLGFLDSRPTCQKADNKDGKNLATTVNGVCEIFLDCEERERERE
jgi:hypothetical protein